MPKLQVEYKKNGRIYKEWIDIEPKCCKNNCHEQQYCKNNCHEQQNCYDPCEEPSSSAIHILPGGKACLCIKDLCCNFILPFNQNEGNAIISGNSLNFYSAPRFSGNALALVETRNHTCNNEYLIKVLCDTSYKTQSGILVANGTNLVSLYNVTNGTNIISTHSFQYVINEIASNTSDMLIYGVSASNNRQIMIYDWITSSSLSAVIDITTYLPPLSTAYITGIGYDNVRNILYVGLSTGSRILALSFYPYVRYPTPIQPSFNPYFITIPNTTLLSGDVFVTDIAVEQNSGNLYFTAKANPSTDSYLYLMTNTGIMLGATDGTYYTPAEKVEQVGRTNDNKIIVNNGFIVYYLANPTLLKSPSIGSQAFTTSTPITDFATPLYGM